jgi:hypothetical protein
MSSKLVLNECFSCLFWFAGLQQGWANLFGESTTEPVSVVTSVFYLGFSVLSFHMSQRWICPLCILTNAAVGRAPALIKILCALLCWIGTESIRRSRAGHTSGAGLGSTLFHATFFFGFAQLDGLPMTLFVGLVLLAMLGVLGNTF